MHKIMRCCRMPSKTLFEAGIAVLRMSSQPLHIAEIVNAAVEAGHIPFPEDIKQKRITMMKFLNKNIGRNGELNEDRVVDRVAPGVFQFRGNGPREPKTRKTNAQTAVRNRIKDTLRRIRTLRGRTVHDKYETAFKTLNARALLRFCDDNAAELRPSQPVNVT